MRTSMFRFLLTIPTSLLLFASAAQAQGAPPKLVLTIDAKQPAQTIEHIGVSGCWYSEAVGKYWPAEKKERIAELLFSKQLDAQGNPRGIGVSAFRFNAGGGTAEQGVASGIRDPQRRVESFVNADGSYDWSKQEGYRWFLQKAKEHGVENLILFSNTPPVQFAQNGLGFKTAKDYRANLKADSYGAFAGFLADVVQHFDRQGLHFKYVSPVNEPQWEWTGEMGNAKQEGTPWTNKEIHRVVQGLDSALKAKRLTTKITAPEAAMLTFLYEGNTAASRQIQQFFTDTSALSLARMSTVPKVVAGHSYFTDTGDSTLINVRKKLADTAKKYGVDFWQSEYSMLGDGFREGARGRRTPMDCALFLAKVIHTDLAVANATAWHLWNAYEPGSAAFDTRYYLIALQPDSGFVNGTYAITKNLWALGHYSLFVRPGMQRLQVLRSDGLDDIAAAQQTMFTAYTNGKGQTVLVAINYTEREQPLQVQLANGGKVKKLRRYVTTAAGEDNMRSSGLRSLNDVLLPARSITTVVVN